MTTQGMPQRRESSSTAMLKALLAAILLALLVLIYLLMVPSSRLERGPLNPVAVNPGSTPPASSFVIHNDAPPTAPPPPATTPAPANAAGFTINPAPAPGAPDTGATSLDAVMQRLRAGKPDPTVVVVPGSPGAATQPPATAPTPAAAAAAPVVPAPVVAAPEAAPQPVPPPSPRWSNVTGQGVQFSISPSEGGLVIAINLGGGQVAQVRVLPAFARLDPAAVNTRVDYLKQTILENFPRGSGSYVFNRDGSVTRSR